MANFNVRLASLRSARSTLVPVDPGAGSATTQPARTYGPIAAASVLDVPLNDAAALAAAGYSILGLSGTTAARPARSDTAWPFLGTNFLALSLGGVLRYFDSTLNSWILWDESAGLWRDSITLAVA